MDGHFDLVPHEVGNRFIDQLRRNSAIKRGGAVTGWEPYDPVEPAPIADDEAGAAGKPAHPRPSRNTIAHENREVLVRMVREIGRREIADHPDVPKILGPAAKLLRVYIDNPDQGFTQEELAERLGCSDRTLRNHLRTLEDPERQAAFQARFVQLPPDLPGDGD